MRWYGNQQVPYTGPEPTTQVMSAVCNESVRLLGDTAVNNNTERRVLPLAGHAAKRHMCLVSGTHQGSQNGRCRDQHTLSILASSGEYRGTLVLANTSRATGEFCKACGKERSPNTGCSRAGCEGQTLFCCEERVHPMSHPACAAGKQAWHPQETASTALSRQLAELRPRGWPHLPQPPLPCPLRRRCQ